MNLVFRFGNREIIMNDLKHVVNNAFRELYASVFQTPVFDLSQLQEAAPGFFDSVARETCVKRRTELHDQFFENFTIIWRYFLDNSRMAQANHLWEEVVSVAASWERSARGHIHKGTPLYFWGVTAILEGKLDKGFALIHRAYEEDRLIEPDEARLRKKPAYCFITLDSAQKEQYFGSWVGIQMVFLKALLADFRKRTCRKLTPDAFRKRFLLGFHDPNTLYLFTYSLARISLWQSLQKHFATPASEFESQIWLSILFDLALVIEKAIEAKNSRSQVRPSFKDQLSFLAKRGNLVFNTATLNRDYDTDPDHALNALLGEKYNVGSKCLSALECDIGTIYLLRNHKAHEVAFGVPPKTVPPASRDPASCWPVASGSSTAAAVVDVTKVVRVPATGSLSRH